MTNYKQFYNAWQSFAKPKRELLLEEVRFQTQMNVAHFLALTTRAADNELENIKKSISKGGFANQAEPSLTVDVDDKNNATVIGHDGRHRATNFKLNTMKQNVGLVKKLTDLIKQSGVQDLNIEKETNHILLFGYPDSVKLNIDDQTRKEISVANEQSDKAKLNISIYVNNKNEGFNYNSIKQFIGQFDKGVRIPNETLIRKPPANQIDPLDPLKIGNEEKTINGYDVDVGTKRHAAGIKNFLRNKKFEIDPSEKLLFSEYVILLNKAYIITDNNGMKYEIVHKSGQPEWEKPMSSKYENQLEKPEMVFFKTSMRDIELNPHPYNQFIPDPSNPKNEDYSAKEKANKLTFTIKKK